MRSRLSPAFGMLLTTTLLGAEDRPLNKVEIAQRGKAATALVDAPGEQGSAFCVHRSGLFITNEHVLRRAGNAPVKLVLDAGLETQRVLSARPVRRDGAHDLALLRVEGDVDLPILPLGSVKGLTELTDLVAFGFPFGTRIAVEKGEYPAISINTGQVTSLRRRKGELHRIQLDAALNPGNSGGPVLDQKGQVVGVVVSGVLGATVNFAIPVSQVKRMVARPVLEFQLPLVTRLNREKPVAFQARAVEILPSAKPLDLELILTSQGKERRHKMTLEKGTYQVRAVPAPAVEGKPRLRIAFSYVDGGGSGIVTDRTVKIGEQDLELSAIRTLRFGSQARATLRDGKTVTGLLFGLEGLVVEAGGGTWRPNLKRALHATIDPPEPMPAVVCAVVARRDGKEVARLWRTAATGELMIRDVQAIHGPLGPERRSLEVSPFDEVVFRYVLKGVRVNQEGRFKGSIQTQLTHSSGKTLVNSKRPLEGLLSLGGNSFLATSRLRCGDNIPAGELTYKVTIADTLSGQTASFQRKLTGKGRTFAVVPRFYSDREGKIPAPAGGTHGQTLFYRFRVIGFDRTRDKIDTSMTLQMLDEKGNEVLAPAQASSIRKDDPLLVRRITNLNFTGNLLLNRPGTFTLRVTFTDHIGKRTARFETPLHVSPR